VTAPATPAESLSAEHRETLGQALADALSWRTPPADCDGCEASPSALCTECAADLDLTDAYIALANELGIEIPT
jgi:hypothetical protein